MKIRKRRARARGIRFSIKREGKEVARAYLYVLRNDLHNEPFGFVEDVFVEESARGKGYGTEILRNLIAEARRQGCYKLVATSRYSREEVHRWYQKLGFENYGVEFRLAL